MEYELKVKDDVLEISSKEKFCHISIYHNHGDLKLTSSGLGFIFYQQKLKNIFECEPNLMVKGKKWDVLMLIEMPKQFQTDNIEKIATKVAKEKGIVIADKIAKNMELALTNEKLVDFLKDQIEVIKYFNFGPVVIKSNGKRKHHWTKKVQNIAFKVNFQASEALVYWQRRNEMLIKKGAVLRTEIPLNKDGQKGFAVRMGEKIRSENRDKISNGILKQDVILRSVNEVGLFLYFGGTNSWKVLKDKDGKTIEEWS